MSVHINDSPEVRQAYRNVLLTDWSASTVVKLLELLDVEIGPRHDTEWGGILDPDNRHAPRPNSVVLDHIRNLASVLRVPALPPIPKSAEDTDLLTRTAEAAWTFLILQDLASIKGDAGLFADTQSALFVCCADHLLPQLKAKHHRAHHDILLNAMYFHTYLVWRNRPDHMYHLQAMLLGYLGKAKERNQLLEQSLRLTPESDHAHLTKVQVYWSELVDGEQYDDAVQLLLDEYRRATKSDEAELKNMLVRTQRMMPRPLVRK